MFPIGPRRGEKSAPTRDIPLLRSMCSLRVSRTERCVSLSLITPCLPTALLPASNCGFTRQMHSPPGARIFSTTGSILLSDMNETSTTAISGISSRSLHPRFLALVRSMTVTLGSFRRRHASWPYPTSTANTLFAPRESRTSVKPPDEAPISMQTLP